MLVRDLAQVASPGANEDAVARRTIRELGDQKLDQVDLVRAAKVDLDPLRRPAAGDPLRARRAVDGERGRILGRLVRGADGGALGQVVAHERATLARIGPLARR